MPQRKAAVIGIAAGSGITFALASAWIPAAFLDVGTGTLHNLKPGERIPTAIGAPKEWTLRTWHELHGPGIRYDLVSESLWMGSKLGLSPSTSPNRTVLHITAGWPFPAMQWDADRTSNPWVSGLPLPWNSLIASQLPRRLPIRPLPWPFAFDFAVYSMLIASALLVSTGLRSWRRRRRGLCTRCAYPLAGLTRCPECGTPAGTAMTG